MIGLAVGGGVIILGLAATCLWKIFGFLKKARGEEVDGNDRRFYSGGRWTDEDFRRGERSRRVRLDPVRRSLSPDFVSDTEEEDEGPPALIYLGRQGV